MKLVGFVPPSLRETIGTERVTLGPDHVYGPKATAETVTRVIDHLETKGRAIIQSYRVDELIDRIDEAVRLLLDRTSLVREKLLRDLQTSEYDREMIDLHLTDYVKQFRAHELRTFLVEDFGNPAVLDTWQPRVKGGLSRAVAAPVTYHSWSGNVPGVSLWSFVSQLLVKGPIFGKVATREPYVATAFAYALEQVDAHLAEAIALFWWPGESELQHVVYERVPLVVAYGHNDTLARIEASLPVTTRLLGYGHKWSFSVIGKEALDAYEYERTLHDVAWDVVNFNQQGCYSPQVVFVERGGNVSPREAAAQLFHELGTWEVKHPIRPLALAEKQRVQAYVSSGRIRAIQCEGAAIWCAPDASYSVRFEPEGAVEPSPLHRHVTVYPFDTIEDVLAALRPLRAYLQTASVATSTERMTDWATQLSDVGVTRLAAVGTMTGTEAGWHHDGRLSVMDLIQWVDIDERLYRASERLVSYRQ